LVMEREREKSIGAGFRNAVRVVGMHLYGEAYAVKFMVARVGQCQ